MTVEIGQSRASGARSRGISPARRIPSRRTMRIRLHFSLLALDLICIVNAFLVAHIVYPIGSIEQSLTIASAIIPVYIISAFGARAYSVEVIAHLSIGIARALRSCIIAAGAVLFVAFYLKSSSEFSRAIFAIGVGTSLLFLAVGRGLFARAARSLLGGRPYAVVLITDGDNGVLPEHTSIVLAASDFDPESQDPAMYDRLAGELKNADRVIVSCAPERRAAWMHLLKGANVQSEILMPELEAISPFMIARYSATPTVVVGRGPLSLPDALLKRAFDLALASAALLLFAPLMLIVAIVIKLESAGPVLFVQTRIGRGNEMFRMYKFRSMRSEASDGRGHTSTRRDDDRITRFGGLLRKSSIDELPQLFNVLLGDMSIVGPRPHALGSRAEDQLFWEIDSRYWHRHAAKPGLTGLAQVRGYRGATNVRSDLVNRLQADLEYLDNWTIWRDLTIIFFTFRVLMHKNAF